MPILLHDCQNSYGLKHYINLQSRGNTRTRKKYCSVNDSNAIKKSQLKFNRLENLSVCNKLDPRSNSLHHKAIFFIFDYVSEIPCVSVHYLIPGLNENRMVIYSLAEKCWGFHVVNVRLTFGQKLHYCSPWCTQSFLLVYLFVTMWLTDDTSIYCLLLT